MEREAEEWRGREGMGGEGMEMKSGRGRGSMEMRRKERGQRRGGECEVMGGKEAERRGVE